MMHRKMDFQSGLRVFVAFFSESEGLPLGWNIGLRAYLNGNGTKATRFVACNDVAVTEDYSLAAIVVVMLEEVVYTWYSNHALYKFLRVPIPLGTISSGALNLVFVNIPVCLVSIELKVNKGAFHLMLL